MPFWTKKADSWLIVGLGNPGEKYAGNRHNIGFMCLDEFARAHRLKFERGRHHAKVAEGKGAGKDVVLVKPMTFMNLSGEAVGKLAGRYHATPERLVVVHDDMDLPLGKMRIRLGGSSGGHKGIASITEHLGAQEFTRVRVGIGRPEARDREEVIEHVLGPLSPQETKVMERTIPAVSEALDVILADGVTAAMNRFNGLDFREAPPK